jgi:NTE family protein
MPLRRWTEWRAAVVRAPESSLMRFGTACRPISAALALQPSPLDRMLGVGNMDFSPSWHIADVLNEVFSPYELNPANDNPLRKLLEDTIDFARPRDGAASALFVCATNVLTIFERSEISVAAVLASAAVVPGDRGYCGNPPIVPLI